MFALLYFGIPFMISFWVVSYFGLSGWRVFALSCLPVLLYGLYGTVSVMFGEGNSFEWSDILTAPLFFAFVAYMFSFPGLLVASLVTIYVQEKYRLNTRYSMLAGGFLGILGIYANEFILHAGNMKDFTWCDMASSVVFWVSAVVILHFVERKIDKKDT
jgi:hypothetical protein